MTSGSVLHLVTSYQQTLCRVCICAACVHVITYSAWRARHAFISLHHKCQRMPCTIVMQLNIGRFSIGDWRFSANSPNRQIKNLAKVSRYTVCTLGVTDYSTCTQSHNYMYVLPSLHIQYRRLNKNTTDSVARTHVSYLCKQWVLWSLQRLTDFLSIGSKEEHNS